MGNCKTLYIEIIRLNKLLYVTSCEVELWEPFREILCVPMPSLTRDIFTDLDPT